MTVENSPLNVDDSALWILYMLKQPLSRCLMELWSQDVQEMWRVERLVYHYFILIHWVPVQDTGSKILCVKLGAMKVTPSDPLHQEYLTINLGSISDWWQLKLPLMRLFGRWRRRCWPGGAAWSRECRRRSSVLPLNLSDTAVNSQDGSSLEFIAPIAGRQCYI